MAVFSAQLPLLVLARVLSVMGAVGVGFLSFLLLTSNPFARLPGTPADGNDLNPLLQDPGLIIHPPLLYMGYVGFSVAFAFAIAALLGGRLTLPGRAGRALDQRRLGLLSLGIMLGSWWAYYELGWGGWWFWDPVENASFMPWLAGTALLHSLAATEKRGLFKSWTLLLAISPFPEPARYLPGALRGADLGPRLCHRPRPRPVYPGVPPLVVGVAHLVRTAGAGGEQPGELRAGCRASR